MNLTKTEENDHECINLKVKRDLSPQIWTIWVILRPFPERCFSIPNSKNFFESLLQVVFGQNSTKTEENDHECINLKVKRDLILQIWTIRVTSRSFPEWCFSVANHHRVKNVLRKFWSKIKAKPQVWPSPWGDKCLAQILVTKTKLSHKIGRHHGLKKNFAQKVVDFIQ